MTVNCKLCYVNSVISMFTGTFVCSMISLLEVMSQLDVVTLDYDY